MTKKEIVKQISEKIGLTQLKTKDIVQLTFDAIIDTLVEERRIELRNFGVFEVKKRAARKARNPRTGERVDVAEKYVVTFKPGKQMEERVRQLEEEAARQHAASAAEASRRPTDQPQPSQRPVEERLASDERDAGAGSEQPQAAATERSPAYTSYVPGTSE